MKKIVSTENAPKAIGPYNQATEAAGFLFVSGQIPIDPANGQLVEGGIEQQARRSLQNVKNIVEAAGLNMADVVKVTVLLADIRDFSTVNEIYKTFFIQDYPARAAFAVAALPMSAMVEIEAIAVRNA